MADKHKTIRGGGRERGEGGNRWRGGLGVGVGSEESEICLHCIRRFSGESEHTHDSAILKDIK